MDVAIGLNATVPGIDRDNLLEWARRADARGFSSLGVIDRIAYPNLEPLVSLAAAAAVTERIRLATTILIAPTRSTTILAKEAASIDIISNGRLTLGFAPGGRPDDFEAAGVDFSSRGKRFDEQLAELKRIWADDQVGPPPVQSGGPKVILGGSNERSFRRTAQFGDGWIAGGMPPDAVQASADSVRQAWEAAGRDGKPYVGGLAYFSLGEAGAQHANDYLKDYYGFLGEYADTIAASAATDAETLKQYVAAYTDAGLDELFIFPSQTDPDQVDLLADAVL